MSRSTGNVVEELLFLVILEAASNNENLKKKTDYLGNKKPGQKWQILGVGVKIPNYISKPSKKSYAKEEYLRTINERARSANEELKSANEEMQSINEELQSTNEET